MVDALVFGGLRIAFDERVLRPRPWTLAQSSWAAELLAGRTNGRVLELCAGVGHIGLSLGSIVPHDLVLVDIDRHACAYAAANARAAGLADRVEIRTGPLVSALGPGEEFSLIIADPPWVPSSLTSQFPEDPLLAIDGGEDGMDVARECISVIACHLAEDGEAILQLGSRAQCAQVSDFLASDPAFGLALGEVRDFGVNGVLVHVTRRHTGMGPTVASGGSGFLDCRGTWHATESW